MNRATLVLGITLGACNTTTGHVCGVPIYGCSNIGETIAATEQALGTECQDVREQVTSVSCVQYRDEDIPAWREGKRVLLISDLDSCIGAMALTHELASYLEEPAFPGSLLCVGGQCGRDFNEPECACGRAQKEVCQ